MWNVAFAELRKLRRPTLFLGTMGAVVFFSALFSSLLFLLIDSPDGNSDRGRTVSRDILALATGGVQGFSSVGGFLGIIALCVFAAQTAQEYTYGTLRNILVRQPGRLRVLAGKFIAMKLFALVMIILSAIISISASVLLAPRAKVSTDLWFGVDGRHAVFTTFINIIISVIGFGTIGMVLGLLLRSPISSISFGVLWLLIVENLLIAVKNSLQDWMPGAQLAAIASGGVPRGMATGIEYSHALLVGGIYVAVGVIVASFLFVRRDVSN
ncbi:MAG: ABC transporter permease [Candidatus Planktophila sp.]|nr:ABC transporter permease [Candidatus Planktophila sp.]